MGKVARDSIDFGFIIYKKFTGTIKAKGKPAKIVAYSVAGAIAATGAASGYFIYNKSKQIFRPNSDIERRPDDAQHRAAAEREAAQIESATIDRVRIGEDESEK